MKLEEVIESFREGKNITRTSVWTGIGSIADWNGINKEYCGDIFTAEDICADDWEVVIE